MSLAFHACAGRVGYATELRAECALRARPFAATRTLCHTCGAWHVNRQPIAARIWAAVRKGAA